MHVFCFFLWYSLRLKMRKLVTIYNFCLLEFTIVDSHELYCMLGWSGGVMVLGKLQVPGHPTIWIIVGQGPTALAVGAGWGCLDIFTIIYPSLLFLSLWETARDRLKYCLKGLLNPKQPTNQCITRYKFKLLSLKSLKVPLLFREKQLMLR